MTDNKNILHNRIMQKLPLESVDDINVFLKGLMLLNQFYFFVFRGHFSTKKLISSEMTTLRSQKSNIRN